MTTMDLFALLTKKRGDFLRDGGVGIETLNACEDGVVYIEMGTADIVMETFSNQPTGEGQ